MAAAFSGSVSNAASKPPAGAARARGGRVSRHRRARAWELGEPVRYRERAVSGSVLDSRLCRLVRFLKCTDGENVMLRFGHCSNNIMDE
ncbi:hypothetical protein EVAR_10385_1 [Eumeta japonica]|uniref:Uncharacterized protein n=1 Tax=Eumeta variegata TaxID=151549 RepID=A0A4C1UCJ2_EUMVA|nr:hypothetical protein EVAR_10385_1 [Eumeta japonica]